MPDTGMFLAYLPSLLSEDACRATTVLLAGDCAVACEAELHSLKVLFQTVSFGEAVKSMGEPL